MAAKSDAVPVLKQQLKDKKIGGLYLFFGEEISMKERYLRQLMALIPDGGFPDFNHLKFDGKTNFEELTDAFESFPMMTEKKLVLIKDSGFFRLKSKPGEASSEEVKSFFTPVFDNLPQDTVLIFDENDVDKRSFMYKSVAKKGLAVEFAYLKEYDMIDYVIRTAKQQKKNIDKNIAAYFVSLCPRGLDAVNNELNKLISFCDKEITKSDIDRLVSKSLEVKVFELTDAIISKNVQKALASLEDMKTQRESAFGILYMMFSAFEKMLHAKLMMKAGIPYQTVLEKTAPNRFTAKKYTESADLFTLDFLMDTVSYIPQIDLKIKQGLEDEWSALERFVLECLSKIK